MLERFIYAGSSHFLIFWCSPAQLSTAPRLTALWKCPRSPSLFLSFSPLLRHSPAMTAQAGFQLNMLLHQLESAVITGAGHRAQLLDSYSIFSALLGQDCQRREIP